MLSTPRSILLWSLQRATLVACATLLVPRLGSPQTQTEFIAPSYDNPEVVALLVYVADACSRLNDENSSSLALCSVSVEDAPIHWTILDLVNVSTLAGGGVFLDIQGSGVDGERSLAEGFGMQPLAAFIVRLRLDEDGRLASGEIRRPEEGVDGSVVDFTCRATCCEFVSEGSADAAPDVRCIQPGEATIIPPGFAGDYPLPETDQ